jgi:hypothetical protein
MQRTSSHGRAPASTRSLTRFHPRADVAARRPPYGRAVDDPEALLLVVLALAALGGVYRRTTA